MGLVVIGGGLLRCSAARLCVCVCVSCRSPNFHGPNMHDLLLVASILAASSSDTSNFLVTCQRHPCEDVMRML